MNGQLPIGNSDSLGPMAFGALVKPDASMRWRSLRSSINPNQTQVGWCVACISIFECYISVLEIQLGGSASMRLRVEVSGCNEIYSDTTVMPYDQWVMTGFTFSKAGVDGFKLTGCMCFNFVACK